MISIESSLKKATVKLDLLTVIDTLLMLEKYIRCGIYHTTKVNNKYIKVNDKNKGSSYLSYWDLTNLPRWTFTKVDYR